MLSERRHSRAVCHAACEAPGMVKMRTVSASVRQPIAKRLYSPAQRRAAHARRTCFCGNRILTGSRKGENAKRFEDWVDRLFSASILWIRPIRCFRVFALSRFSRLLRVQRWPKPRGKDAPRGSGLRSTTRCGVFRRNLPSGLRALRVLRGCLRPSVFEAVEYGRIRGQYKLDAPASGCGGCHKNPLAGASSLYLSGFHDRTASAIGISILPGAAQAA